MAPGRFLRRASSSNKDKEGTAVQVKENKTSSDGLQPKSDGLHPTGNGLQHSSEKEQ